MFVITLTLLLIVQLNAKFSRECAHQSSSLNPYGSRCKFSNECINNYCYRNRCQCPYDQFYDSQMNLCLPNCNTNITRSAGKISTSNVHENSKRQKDCKWIIMDSANSYVVFSSSVRIGSPSSKLKPTDYWGLDDHYVSFSKFYRNGSLEHIAIAYAFHTQSKTYATTLNSGLQIELDSISAGIGGPDFLIVYRVYEKDAQITDTYGLIASPGYPNSYPASSRFTWTILGKSNTFILTDLKLDGCCDSLTIYNGTSNSSAPLVRLYNENPQKTFTTKGPMYIVFETNSANQSDGFSAVFYRQDLDYAEKCDLNIDGMCKPGLACRCDKYTEARCLCPDGHYFLGNNCIYALQTKVLPTETSVSLDIHNVSLNFVSHQIIWSTCWEIREKLTKITREVISGLTPGQEYNVKIISTLAADTYNDPTVLKSNFIVITLPAQPGEVLEEKSNLNSPPYVLKFNSSQGIVLHYNITLVSDTQVLTYQVNTTELVTSDLTADTLYNYTITAFNKLGNESTTFRGNITTGPDKSVSVGVIAGITISVIVLLCCVAVGIVVLDRKRRTQITHFLRLCVGNILQREMENSGSLSKSRNKKASSGGKQLKGDPKDSKHSYDVVIVPSSPDVAGLYRDLNQSTPAENCYANSSAVKKYLDSSIYEDM